MRQQSKKKGKTRSAGGYLLNKNGNTINNVMSSSTNLGSRLSYQAKR